MPSLNMLGKGMATLLRHGCPLLIGSCVSFSECSTALTAWLNRPQFSHQSPAVRNHKRGPLCFWLGRSRTKSGLAVGLAQLATWPLSSREAMPRLTNLVLKIRTPKTDVIPSKMTAPNTDREASKMGRVLLVAVDPSAKG